MRPPDEAKRRRRGPAPLAAEEKRGHTVSARLNEEELARLDAQRAGCRMQRGEYLRAAALHHLPPVIPEINREAWAKLAHLAANLNQYQAAINQGRTDAPPVDLVELRDLVQKLRRNLLGVKDDEG